MKNSHLVLVGSVVVVIVLLFVLLRSGVFVGQVSPNAACGNGNWDTPAEECEDGNTQNGDGCSSTCRAERGWTCAAAGSCIAYDVIVNNVISPGSAWKTFLNLNGPCFASAEVLPVTGVTCTPTGQTSVSCENVSISNGSINLPLIAKQFLNLAPLCDFGMQETVLDVSVTFINLDMASMGPSVTVVPRSITCPN